MYKFIFCWFSFLLTFSLSVVSMAHSQRSDDVKVTFKKEEIKPGLFVLSGQGGFTGGNILVSSGPDGVYMIDSSMPKYIDLLKKEIKSISDKPLKFLINTHVHGDHTGNNSTFGSADAHLIAHDSLRKRLIEKNSDASALPKLTVDSTLNLYLNEQKAELIHFPSAHTDGDVAVYFPSTNVLHTGDLLFNGLFPFIDLGTGGTVEGYSQAQQNMMAMINDETIVVPGHGPITNKAGIAASNQMLQDSMELIAELIKKGKSEDEVVKLNPLNKYHEKWNWGFITTEKMTRQIYKGLSNQG